MTSRKLYVALCAAALTACGESAVDRGDANQTPAITKEAHHDVSPPLFLVPPAERVAPTEHEVKPIPRNFNRGPVRDQALQTVTGQALLLAPSLSQNFDGIGNGFAGPAGTFLVNSAPPDTNGDVGPNHYVQTVNTDYAVFNKSGTAVFGPVPMNTLFRGFGGLCETTNDGDPIVIYDPIADRWIASQFAVTGANGSTVPFLQCVAVSTTGDPTGAYARYSFPYSRFPDYPKFGVWPDAYYVTFNLFNGNLFAGGQVCAYDRAKMLAGAAATQQCFNVGTSFGGLLPADLDGAALPPAGSPEYIVALGATANTLAYWTMTTDFATPANTRLVGPTTLSVAAFSEACAGGTCIPQPGTAQKLDSLADRLMYRLAYRNLNGVGHLVTNHSITAGTSTGVRWYELTASSATLALAQQGTWAPDANFRWMGAAAMDKAGNIGLGYSVSSTTVKPGVHFTGRVAGDPAGTMTQGENIVFDGAGVQTANLSRWGDYSMMAVDPVDDCTFWFTSEYEPANGTFNWHTRIGSFTLPNCVAAPPPPADDFSISASPTSVSVLQGNTAPDVTISTAITNGVAQTVNLSASGLPAGATATFTPASISSGGSATLSIATSATTPGGTYTVTVTGTGTAATHSTTVTLTVTTPAPPDFTIAVSPASQTVARGGSTTYTVTVTAVNGFTGTVALSVTGQPRGATTSFNPASIAGSGSSVLTVTAASNSQRGTFPLTITGTSGTVSHSTSASFVVSH